MLTTKFLWSVLIMVAIGQFDEACLGTLRLTMQREKNQQPVSGHRVFDANGHDYIGGNTIVGALPPGYENFLIMWVDYKTHLSSALSFPQGADIRARLIPDSEGRINVEGRVVFKGHRYPEGDSDSDGKYRSYEFKDAYLSERTDQPVKLVFDTDVVNGVSYHFEGSYVEVSSLGWQDKQLYLSGRMTQFTNGNKSAETKLTFKPVHRDSD